MEYWGTLEVNALTTYTKERKDTFLKSSFLQNYEKRNVTEHYPSKHKDIYFKKM